MAVYNFRISLHSHILFCSFFLITSYILDGNALNFNLTNIKPRNLNVNLTVEPDAYISTKGIQLTPDEHRINRRQKAGRAMYIEPLHLWDKASGNLTEFDTHFSFVIDSDDNEIGGDGLTFFLIPLGNTNNTKGGAMGLPLEPVHFRATSPFVAVEFDTFNDPGFDPENITSHVGIDVNSIRSSVATSWIGNITNQAWISYNSNSKNLTVIFTGIRNNTRVLQELHFVVDLRESLPEWVRIGFSASTGTVFQRHTIKSWRFRSSLQIDEKTGPSWNGRSDRTGLIVGFTLGFSFLVLGLALLGFFLSKRHVMKEEHGFFIQLSRRIVTKEEFRIPIHLCKENMTTENGFSIQLSMEKDFRRGSGPKQFSYIELSRATSDFDEGQKLGEGGFGGVYRGFLSELNSYVAVKRISKGSKQGIKEYAAEVKIISSLRHRSLVQLIGWCHEKGELLLVYEFMANASLDIHLYKDKSLLTWETRYKIAKCLGSALLYLHEEWEQCVVHRDVKPSNVMLDQNFNAKLGDFGLARLVDHEKGSNQTTVLAGTMGYMAPESVVKGKPSKESDVYSFGIVALEIACGRKPIDTSVMQENQVMLVEFVWDLYGQENLLSAADSKLGLDFDRDETERLMIVGLWCAHPDHKLRPSIRQAIHVLNFEAPLPNLPGRMPVATYVSLPATSFLSLIYPNQSIMSKVSPIKSSSYIQDTDYSTDSSSSNMHQPCQCIPMLIDIVVD